jgi:thiol-disulfide isomerase/thioredoxin
MPTSRRPCVLLHLQCTRALTSGAQINGSISKPAVINFGAESSGPCQSIMPVYEELSQEFPNIAFYYIDMDEAIDTMDICRSISSVRYPHLVLHDCEVWPRT